MRKATVLTALLGIAALFLAGKADAAGLYVLGDVGFKSIYQQDMNDSFAGDLDPYGNSYDFGWATLPEGGLTVGYRFQGPFSLEGGVDFLGGRADSDDYGDTFTVNPTTTFYFGPVLCLDHYRWFFAQRGVSEIGIHVSYASVAGSVDYGYGSGGADFSGSATGFGIFFRDLNIWQYSGVTLGFKGRLQLPVLQQPDVLGHHGFRGGHGWPEAAEQQRSQRLHRQFRRLLQDRLRLVPDPGPARRRGHSADGTRAPLLPGRVLPGLLSRIRRIPK